MTTEVIKEIEEKIEVLYSSLMKRPLQVLDIFNDFFGEENVDMQKYPDLPTFKEWINNEPVCNFIRGTLGVKDWETQRLRPITELPDELALKIVDLLPHSSTLERIGESIFNNIFIIVHFPHVRITNEHDRYVDINHLWARIKIDYKGSMAGRFTLNRSEYTLLHLRENYMHSHVCDIPFGDFTLFQTPCTGDGPINSTISTLNRAFDEDMWNMFCLELSKYVTVESIAGRPYHYLERLGTETMRSGGTEYTTYLSMGYYSDSISEHDIKEFVKYFINSKCLKFNYVNGSFSVGMPYTDFIISISNKFIEWYNNQYNKGEVSATLGTLKRYKVLKECIIEGNNIYYENSINNNINFSHYIGEKVCMFKGREITIDITDAIREENNNRSLTLNPRIALYILTIILKVLNYRYGRNKAIYKGNQISTEVRYL